MNKSTLLHAIVSTDIVLLGLNTAEQLVTILVPVLNSEYKNKLAFPGGLIRPQESAHEAIVRILDEKVGISASEIYIDDLRSYSSVQRDVRGRVVSIAHVGYIRDIDSRTINPECVVKPIRIVKGLAYDHDEMLADAVHALKGKLVTSTVIQKLLPIEFTLPQLYLAYTIILDEVLDKRNFLKKIKALDIITETGKLVRTGPHRPAQLYRFTSEHVKTLPLL